MDSKQFVQVIRTKYNKYTAVIARYHDKFRECLELQVSWVLPWEFTLTKLKRISWLAIKSASKPNIFSVFMALEPTTHRISSNNYNKL